MGPGLEWVVAISSLPASMAVYWYALFLLNARYSVVREEVMLSHFDWIYAPFVGSIAVVYGVTADSLAWDFTVEYLLAVPLGVALYRLTNRGWGLYTGTRPRRGERNLAALLPGLLVVPFAEELLYREGLSALVAVHPAAYVLVSAVAFGLLHAFLGRHEVAFKTGLGVVLAATYLASGSVAVPALFHFGYNLGWAEYVTDGFL